MTFPIVALYMHVTQLFYVWDCVYVITMLCLGSGFVNKQLYVGCIIFWLTFIF